MSLSEDRRTRRRGAELEAAILDAAWDQLAAHGYAGLTFEAVAERAGTSRPVLHRRWASRADLLRAAVRRRGGKRRIPVPDTGSLRDDVLAALRDSNRHRADLLILLSTSLGEFYGETGGTPQDVRDLLVEGQTGVMDAVLARAAERGEVDPARLTPRARSVAFDLYRYEVLMGLRRLPDAELARIVDEVFLPLVTGAGYRGAGDHSRIR